MRDAQLYVQWVNPSNAGQTQDLTAPITGHGRQTASGCASDAACGAAQSCQLIPHYLEVRALETTCQRAVGAVAGQAVCSADSQCRSGLCISGTCFAACTGASECGGRVCDPNRANVSLEPVRTGLGSAKGRGCMP